jgi:hypothetical protein
MYTNIFFPPKNIIQFEKKNIWISLFNTDSKPFHGKKIQSDVL